MTLGIARPRRVLHDEVRDVRRFPLSPRDILMMTRHLRVVLLIAPWLLLACRDDGISPDGRGLEIAEARWRAQGLSHYTVETRVLCFCTPEVNRWHEITVASDSVIAVRRVETGEVQGEPAQPSWFRSVEGVFQLARRWPSMERGNRVEASFAAPTGLPERVSLITSPAIADGGAVYEYRALKPGLTGNARVARSVP
ncbi:MAG: DUF6174 domain-containing protein [Gemmatimonadaceae bacterium]|jgi:hypothetical protein|nr:DUF6174 domain-containing protein [Gemmatimonadaceae bacterium]